MAKKNRKEEPKVLWSNMLNLSGLYSDKPIRCTRRACKWSGEVAYWDKSGNYDTAPNELGEIEQNEGVIIKFTSKDKKEVELWTQGVKAALRAIGRYCK